MKIHYNTSCAAALGAASQVTTRNRVTRGGLPEPGAKLTKGTAQSALESAEPILAAAS